MKKLIILFCAVAVMLTGCGVAIIEETPSVYEQAMEDGELCIVIDAGHGFSDVGAMNEENLGSVTEAEINFEVALALCAILNERGYTAILSHNGETIPKTQYDDGDENKFGTYERAEISNTSAADIFVSIHCDSFPDNADVYGTRLYYGVDTPNSTKLDETLAESLKSGIEGRFPNDKKVILKPMQSTSAYTVLYETKAPSVLVECGFITNKGDAEKLLDSEWRNNFATSLANGIDLYFKK